MAQLGRFTRTATTHFQFGRAGSSDAGFADGARFQRRSVNSDVRRRSHTMATTTTTTESVEQRGLRKPWLYLALIVGLSVATIPLAAGFFVPTGPSSYVKPPGVVLFVALASACCWLSMRCPNRPLWAKVAALVLSLPSLFFAVDSMMMLLAFGIHR